MSKPTVNVPPQVSEYHDAMKAWTLAAAEWLGLDPEATVSLDVTEREFNDFGGSTVEAKWSAVTQLTPRAGHVHSPSVSSDGEVITYGGAVSLDYDDSEAFREAVGPKPEMFTAEERAALLAAFGRSE